MDRRFKIYLFVAAAACLDVDLDGQHPRTFAENPIDPSRAVLRHRADCRIGDGCIFSNNATLAGHVQVGDHVILGGFAAIHQFCRLGAHAFIGMGAFVNGDVPPFLMVAQEGYGRPRGINAEGLRRRGFDSARISTIKRAYRALYVSGDPLEEARGKLAGLARDSEDVRALLDFIEASERPLLR